MAAPITVTAIDHDDPLMNAFIDLPWQLHRPDHWVPPVKAMIHQELAPDNLFFNHGRARYFIAMAQDQCVGRIVASVDDNRVQTGERTVGHFGYFECVNNPAVANALLDAAEQWLARQGVQEVHGPVNFTIFNSYRLQIKGFELAPFYGEPRNPEYYPDLLRQCGYDIHYRWGSWDLSDEDIECISESAAHTEDKILNGAAPDYRLRQADMDAFEAELERLYPVALKTYENNYGFSRIPLEEFMAHFAPYKWLVPGDSFLLAEHNELGLVGFYYGYPDYAPALQHINGDSERLGEILTHQPDRVVAYNIGVIDQVRRSAIPYTAFKQVFRKGLSHDRGIVGALAKQGRCVYTKTGEPDREYAVMSRILNSPTKK